MRAAGKSRQMKASQTEAGTAAKAGPPAHAASAKHSETSCLPVIFLNPGSVGRPPVHLSRPSSLCESNGYACSTNNANASETALVFKRTTGPPWALCPPAGASGSEPCSTVAVSSLRASIIDRLTLQLEIIVRGMSEKHVNTERGRERERSSLSVSRSPRLYSSHCFPAGLLPPENPAGLPQKIPTPRESRKESCPEVSLERPPRQSRGAHPWSAREPLRLSCLQKWQPRQNAAAMYFKLGHSCRKLDIYRGRAINESTKRNERGSVIKIRQRV